jgi:hypothetical protein
MTQTRGIMIDTGDVSNAPDYAISLRGQGWATVDTGITNSSRDSFHSVLKPRRRKRKKMTASTVELTYTGLVTIHEFTMPDGSKSGAKGVQADTTDAAFYRRRTRGSVTGTDTGNAW